MNQRDPGKVDVAVVGAGIGGCYVAYRLLEAERRASSIGLYERSTRIGGRLWSVQTPLVPSTAMELGGMRFHAAEHHVVALVRHLGLDKRVVPFESWRPENIVYVRGVRLRANDLRRDGLDERALVLTAVEAAIPGFVGLWRKYHHARGSRDRGKARDIRRSFLSALDAPLADGTRLRDIPWSQLVDKGLSADGVSLLRAADGYDGYSTNGNAADWVSSIFHEAPGTRYLTISGGIQSLVRGVHARFSAAGGRTFLGHELRRVVRAVADDGLPVFELRFQVSSADGRELIIRARTVILALPQQAIQALDSASALLTPAARADVDAVQDVPAFKLFLVYPFPWWRTVGLRTGRSTTDLPLRQVWYLSCDPARPGLIMAAYPAGPSVRYWDAFRSGPLFGCSGSTLELDGEQTRPTAAMVAHAHELLGEMHGVADAPDPIGATWFDWGGSPHRAAWHVWRPGRDSAETARRLAQPERTSGLYLVSDCWTNYPGSVQGSLSATESVLVGHLGCSAPRW